MYLVAIREPRSNKAAPRGHRLRTSSRAGLSTLTRDVALRSKHVLQGQSSKICRAERRRAAAGLESSILRVCAAVRSCRSSSCSRSRAASSWPTTQTMTIRVKLRVPTKRVRRPPVAIPGRTRSTRPMGRAFAKLRTCGATLRTSRTSTAASRRAEIRAPTASSQPTASAIASQTSCGARTTPTISPAAPREHVAHSSKRSKVSGHTSVTPTDSQIDVHVSASAGTLETANTARTSSYRASRRARYSST